MEATLQGLSAEISDGDAALRWTSHWAYSQLVMLWTAPATGIEVPNCGCC
jgi:hypothetical protein